MSEPQLFEVTVAACPYCGQQSFDEIEVALPHPTRKVMKCVICDRFSTRQRGKHFPHDEPLNPESTIANRVRVIL